MSYRCKQLVILIALCLSLSLFLPQAQAQQVYTQPMYQVSWTTKTVLIQVPDSPAWARTDFESAAQDWNQAQQWFLESYEPNHPSAYYTLQLAQAGEIPQVTVQYVPDTGQQWWGQTSISRTGAQILVVLSRFNGMPSALQTLWEHELGHVLGLYDNCVKNDLMLGLCNGVLLGPLTAYYPSTLDLYAAYAEAVSGNAYGYGDTVSLPSQIPYQAWYPGESAVPEFPSPILLLLVVVPVLVFVLKKRKRP